MVKALVGETENKLRITMASKNRRKKRPLPDWVGESYDAKQKDDEPGECTAIQSRKEQLHSTKAVLPLRAQTSATFATVGVSVSDQQQVSHGKINELPAVASVPSASSDEVVPLSAEEIIRLSIPLLKFDGSLIYSFNKSDCSLLCEDILSCLSHEDVCHVGFDMEWPVTYFAGATSKTALIQICTNEDKCYLFHIAPMGTLPKALKTLLSSSQIIKYGINIETDFWKLERDFDIQVRSIIRDSVKDLGKLANVKLRSAERWSLDGLTRNVFRKRLNKDGTVRCGQWDHYPLSDEQLQYAATDAYACWLLANHLRDKSTCSRSGSGTQ